MRIWVPLPALLTGCLLPMDADLGRNLGIGVPDRDGPIADRDQDGVTLAEGDCDDWDPDVAPDKREDCDGKDNDCDSLSDNGGACQIEERFTQEMKTDVLLVVDNSYLMSSYWWQASLGADAMTQHLVGGQSDTQIAVLFNDMDNPHYSGNLVVPAQFAGSWLEGDDPRLTANAIESYFNQTLLYQQAAGPEADHGMRWAVERAMQLGEGPNGGFFRPDASLNLIFVTNREDNPIPDNATFLADLVEAEGALSEITVYAVTQTTTVDCLNPQTPVEPANSILSLVQQTGGFYESVCLGDWTGFFSSVGQSIANESLRTTFSLQSAPRQDTVRITVQPDDGSDPYPWTEFAFIDEVTLIFPGAAPPIDSTIVVDYIEDWRYL